MDRHEEAHADAVFAAAQAAISAASASGLSVGTAESLTGGSVAAALVSVPGASAVFEGSVVSYSHAVKIRALGVSADLLDRVGAVDPAVAQAMAEGARDALGVDVAVSTTGVAGPEPHDGKAVGTVFLGVAGPDSTHVRELHLTGSRAQIRTASVTAALEDLAAHCRFPDFSQ